MRAWLLALLFVACGGSPPAHSVEVRADSAAVTHVTPTGIVWDQTLDCPNLTLIVPFLEGLAMRAPLPNATVAYPGPLSMPMIGWSCDGSNWQSIHTATPYRPPIRLSIRPSHVELRCTASCELRSAHVRGTWMDLARAVAADWRVSSGKGALAKWYSDVHFYVHDWIDTSDPQHPKKTDFSVADLSVLAKASPHTLSFVYGLDPGGVDLEGHYLAPPADQALDDIRRAAPNAALYHWLNLRTYKYAIPALGIDRPPPPEIRKAAKQYANGPNEIAQYSFKGLEMCIASKEWQASRMAEMDRLIAAGFKVIALDEFPITPRWDGEPCASRDHLHRPSDAADEWDVTLRFIGQLEGRAHRSHVLLGSEEPCVGIVPYLSAYMDGTFNDPPEVYEWFAKNAQVDRIPLFSTMFADRVTPITRPSPKKPAPAPWITMRKVTKSGLEPP